VIKYNKLIISKRCESLSPVTNENHKYLTGDLNYTESEQLKKAQKDRAGGDGRSRLVYG